MLWSFYCSSIENRRLSHDCTWFELGSVVLVSTRDSRRNMWKSYGIIRVVHGQFCRSARGVTPLLRFSRHAESPCVRHCLYYTLRDPSEEVCNRLLYGWTVRCLVGVMMCCFIFFLYFFLSSILPVALTSSSPMYLSISLSLIRFPSYRSIRLSLSIPVTCVHLLSLFIYRCIFCLPSFSFSVFTQSPLSFSLSPIFCVCLPHLSCLSLSCSQCIISPQCTTWRNVTCMCTNVHSKRINIMKTCACVYDVLCCTVRLVKRVPRVVCIPDFFVVKIWQRVQRVTSRINVDIIISPKVVFPVECFET